MKELETTKASHEKIILELQAFFPGLKIGPEFYKTCQKLVPAINQQAVDAKVREIATYTVVPENSKTKHAVHYGHYLLFLEIQQLLSHYQYDKPDIAAANPYYQNIKPLSQCAIIFNNTKNNGDKNTPYGYVQFKSPEKRASIKAVLAKLGFALRDDKLYSADYNKLNSALITLKQHLYSFELPEKKRPKTSKRKSRFSLFSRDTASSSASSSASSCTASPATLTATSSAISSKPDYTQRICLLGDKGAGSTALIIRYIEDCYGTHLSYGPSILKRTINYETHTIKQNVWDKRRSDRFHTGRFIETCDTYIICIDQTNLDSFNNVKKRVDDSRCNKKDTIILLAATKHDLTTNLAATDGQVQAFADNLNLPLFFTSAKNGDGVVELFTAAAKLFLEQKNPIQKTEILISKSNTKSCPIQ